jgi:hypothetical protein
MNLLFLTTALATVQAAIDELDMLVLQAIDTLSIKTRTRRLIERGDRRFNINTFPNFYEHFRMDKEQFVRLYEAFQIEAEIVVHGSKFTGMEALAITMYRLSYPYRLVDLCEVFGRYSSELSRVFNHMIHQLHTKYAHLFPVSLHPV